MKLFVSPASFTSFGPWMLLQHFDAKHEVVNVQVLDDYSRETFASNFSPLIPSVRTICRKRNKTHTRLYRLWGRGPDAAAGLAFAVHLGARTIPLP